ncbi:MAG: hypothetical protein QJR12_06120 [Mycobacterium sp.]|uniref:hypothetical protein n=1 Tax=Mycobacterium sp. TaxID=1785 RepID=UPI00261BE901|nr:hypothetical protein [Mycobacterium sp.]MDI3313864.1 hypothetical protein [Mycobacterium sp.]
MLIIALVLAVIGLAALVFAVVTSNELVAWVCIAASAAGVVLLIVDALQERRERDTAGRPPRRPVDTTSPGAQDPTPAPGADASVTGETSTDETFDAEYPESVDTGADETPARKPGAGGDG